MGTPTVQPRMPQMMTTSISNCPTIPPTTIPKESTTSRVASSIIPSRPQLPQGRDTPRSIKRQKTTDTCMIHPRSTSAVDPGSPSVDYDRVGVDSGYASQSTSGPNTPGQHAEADSCFLKVANVQRSLFPGNRIVVKT